MSKRLLIVPLLALLLLYSPWGHGQQSKGTQNGSAANDTLRVLFVGNSYTYFYNMPQMVGALASSTEVPMLVRQSTAGGVNWKQHWAGDKGLQTKALIDGHDWDVVVLQNHSLSTINAPEQFMEYGKKWINYIKQRGSTPLLYMTWGRAHNPLMQQQISNGYEQLGAATGVEVVPVGLVWEAVRHHRPDVQLYDPDGSHPSPTGSYLIACIFYAQLTGKPAKGLPHRLTDTDKNGEKLYLSIMPQTDAEFVQQVAHQVLSNYPKARNK